jgi:hypothetical protein
LQTISLSPALKEPVIFQIEFLEVRISQASLARRSLNIDCANQSAGTPLEAAPHRPDLARRQATFFLPLTGYDPRTIIAEADDPGVHRQLGGPTVFIFDNERHAVALLH